MAEDKMLPQDAGAGCVATGNLSAAPWLKTAGCQAVFDAIEQGGYAARAVGGAVRNALMGIDVADVDIATPALPEVVMGLCREAGLSVHATGLAHGTVTVVSNHVPYEVTTLRRDVETHGRHATVAYTEDWAEDAARRDFTMNALYCDRQGKVYDPLVGLGDLRDRKVRFIGSARLRIQEDYLRILRFFRFFAAFGSGEIDAEGLRACIDEREGLRRLSAERIRSEFLKLLMAPRVREALHEMLATGIDEIATGQPSNLDRFETFVTLESQQGVPPSAITRLAALAAPGVEEARELATKIRLSNVERQQLVRTADGGLDIQFGTEKGQRIALYRLGACDYRSSCLMAWTRSGADLNDAAFRDAFELPDRWQPSVMPFKGADVISRGVPPGPLVGRTLDQFEKWWIASGFPDNSAVLDGKFSELVNAAKKQ